VQALNIVLIGDKGRAALPTIAPGAVVHAVGWYPAFGETSRAIVCHTRTEQEVADIVSADMVIGGDPAVWGRTIEPVTEIDTPAPKRRGRPPKVK
jgi:hypothetical protein